MSHQTAVYSREIALVTKFIHDLVNASGLPMNDGYSAVADALIDGFIQMRNAHGDAIVPEMQRFARRLNELAATPTAHAMFALSEHLADANAPAHKQ